MTRKKPWGGRFSQPTDRLVEQFTESVSFDRRLYKQDIRGSVAHARMLAKVGVLTQAECEAVVEGLASIERDIEQDRFKWSPELEDVHMNIEAQLTERIGEVGKKLHTGRSRNDQVATDLRLYLRDVLDLVEEALVELQTVLVEMAEREAETIMPGFTHLQVAQPVTLGHHLLAWYEMLQRDRERFRDARERINVMPLGAAALAGTTFDLDRDFTARELEFAVPAANSLDAVSDRDFVIEFVAHGALLMVHLSRIAEELVLWMSERFRFITIGDAFCTGSSIMPQKKNPDVAELIRGKCSRVTGDLSALLMLMKAQPLAYNRDNQEDKEPVFDTVDTILASLRILAAMLPTIEVDREAMLAAARQGFATATDLAEYLVRKGVPFRDAHEVVGNVVRACLERNIDLAAMELEGLREFHRAIEGDVYDVLTLEGSVASRRHHGGTAPAQVRLAVQRARERLQT